MRTACLPPLAILALLAGCQPEPEPVPPPETILYSYGYIGMSGGNWDMPATANLTVRVYGYSRPTTLTLLSATLFRRTDLQTPLASLALDVENPQLDFTASDNVYVSLVNAGMPNRTLSTACGQVTVALLFHSSSCNCDIRVEGDDSVLCYADNGADAELAAVGEPAPAGRPCGSRHYSTTSGVEQLDGEDSYRYDSQGRLLFTDVLDSALVRQERIFYTYELGPLLRERESISPATRAVSSRDTYRYVSGVLSTIERDGDLSHPPDGLPDSTWTYAFGGNTWTETGSATRTYTCDPVALTVSRSDAIFYLAAAIDEPSRFFATSFLDMPKILRSEHTQGGATITLTYSYSSDALLEVRSSEALGMSFRDEYLYVCQ